MAMDIGTLVAYLDLDSSKFEEGAKGAGAKMPGWMSAAGAVAGVAVAAAFTASFIGAVNMEAGTDKIAAQLGLTEDEAERAGAAAAGAYGNAFGDSLETVQATTAGVVSSIQGMRDASVDELQGIVEGVQGISDGFEIEADRISQVVGQMLSTGMAGSAQEGLDLLTAALQKVPAAVREDILDATDEYGPFFASIGMSGEDAMNALVASSEKGMYGIDKTGDAIKELSIRATDMSTTSVAAYEAAGLNAEEMAGKILAGGDAAKEGFTQIVDGLLGIEDPTARANAAIGLFGTPLEDLGVTEIPAFLESLKGIDGGMGDVAGATQRMTDTLGGNVASTWEGFTRQVGLLGTELGERLLPLVQPAIDALVGGLEAVSPVILDMATALGDFMESSGLAVPIIAGLGAALLAALAPAIWAAVTATWAFTTALLANPITWIVIGIGLLVAAIVWLVMNWDTAVAWITEVWTGFMGWIGEVIDGFVSWWNEVWAGFGSWITSVWEGFIGWITGIWSGFVGWLTGVGDGIASWWNGLWAGIGAWIQSVWEGFIGFVRGIFQGYVSWVMSVASGFVNGWNSTWARVGQIIQDVWNNVVSFFQGIPGAINGLLAGAGQWLYNIGRDIIQGLWNGLKSIWSSVSAWFENTFGGIVDTVAGIFGIHSPSRVFRDFGINIGQGFIQGLGFMTPQVEMAVEDMAHVPDTAAEFIARYPVSEGRGDTFVYNAAENQSLDSEEALFEALGSPRSPFGGK